MIHDHDYDHNHPLDRLSRAFFLNFGFSILELVGGFLTGSYAVLASAAHDFGDSVTLAIGYGLQKISHRKPQGKFTYGYKRVSLVSAILTAGILIIGSLFIAANSVHRLMNPEQLPNPWGMIGLACVGVVINGYAAWTLIKGHSMNERILSWHLVEDALGWFAVFSGGLAVYFFKSYWVDPALAVGISIFIIWRVLSALKKTILLFLQTAPEGIDVQSLRQEVEKIEGVLSIHDLHFWSLDGEHHILTLHLKVPDNFTEVQPLKIKIRRILKGFGKIHSTIEIEASSDDCSEDLTVHH